MKVEAKLKRTISLRGLSRKIMSGKAKANKVVLCCIINNDIMFIHTRVDKH